MSISLITFDLLGLSHADPGCIHCCHRAIGQHEASATTPEEQEEYPPIEDRAIVRCINATCHSRSSSSWIDRVFPLLYFRILYDRLTSTTTPTNPYALHAAHLALLPSASSFTSQNGSHPRPPSVLDPPPYPVQDPAASEAAQSHLVERIRLAALKGGDVFGEIKTHGIAGEPTTTTTTAAAIAPVDDAPMMDVALSVGSGSHLV